MRAVHTADSKAREGSLAICTKTKPKNLLTISSW
jgi:hypothetical protein